MESYTVKTDDQRFEFQFVLRQNGLGLVEAVDTRIFYIDIKNGSLKIPKFEKLNVKPDEKIVFEIRDLAAYALYGNAMLKIVNSNDGIFCGMDAHFHYGDRLKPIEFDGFLFYIPVNAKPISPMPPDIPEIGPISGSLQSELENDLFPYIYMRKWPGISAAEFSQHFLKYTKSMSAGKFLIDALIQDSKDRAAMQNESVNFIKGKGDYNPAYLQSIQNLEKPFDKIYPFFEQLYPETKYTLNELRQSTLEYFGMTDESAFRSFLTSELYLKNKERCWQTYFSLIFAMGYNTLLMEQLTGILICANLLEQIFQLAEDSLGDKTINNLLNATICLPDGLFPDKSDNKANKNLLRPYAIGDLQLVKQRFVCYELGEISDIINVMKGEEKEIRDRSFVKNEEYNEDKTILFDTYKNYDEDSQTNLTQLINQTINNNTRIANFSDLKTTYGPPNTFTYSGSATYTEPDNNKKDNSSYAKEIVHKALSDFSNAISNIRRKLLTNESEKITISKIDNKSSNSNYSAILRWVNKVYHNYIVNYGTRLMYELLIEKPANQFINTEMLLKGVNLQMPVNPKTIGISSYTDIKRKNFNKLSLYYNNLSAPLPINYTISTFLNGSETKILRIKEQYAATSANIAIIQSKSNDTQNIQVAIGTTIFKASTDKDGQSLKGETNEIPVSSIYHSDSNPPTSEMAEYAVNVQIVCTLADSNLEDWQMKVYKEIFADYKLQLQNHCAKLEEQFGKNQLSKNIQIVKQSIIQHCKQEMYINYLNKTDSSYSDNLIANFGILQFIDSLFEWNEMYFIFVENISLAQDKKSYSLSEQLRNCGEFFNQFMIADFVHVILPVRPEYELSALLFTDTGILWSGKHALCCCSSSISENDGPVEIVNEIKKRSHHTELRTISDSWEIKVPTDMQMLQDAAINIKEIIR